MSPRGHVVAFTILAWGHAKATCTLITKIVRYGNVHATLFAPIQFYGRLKEEVAANFVTGTEDDLKDLVRVVGLECEDDIANMTRITSEFLDGYKRLCSSQPIKITPTGNDYFTPLVPPQLVIVDFFTYDALQGVRRETGNAVPVYALESVSASAVIFLWGPEYLGGNGDLEKKLRVITTTDEREAARQADAIYRRVKGELLRIPGLPPMYDHEFSPTKLFTELPIAKINALAHRFFLDCDGVIMNATSLLEKEAIDAVQEWLKKPIICPAPFDFPLLPGGKSDRPPVESKVDEFLNRALQKYGPNSVVYMSFGTTFWSSEPEKIWAALDVFIECGIPFMFARASPFAVVPEEIEKKIEDSGLGMVSKWLPQTSILSHEACGWFVTHGGHNSFTEALTAGMPMICWPFDIDQPLNAALASDIYNIGYELFETRSWHGLKPIHRFGNKSPEGTVEAFKREFRDVLKKATGEDGRVKRTNIQRLQQELAKSWEPDGDAWKEIKRIVDVLH